MIYQIKQDLNPLGWTQSRVVGIVGTICLVETRKNLRGDFHGSQSSMARIAAPDAHSLGPLKRSGSASAGWIDEFLPRAPHVDLTRRMKPGTIRRLIRDAGN